MRTHGRTLRTTCTVKPRPLWDPLRRPGRPSMTMLSREEYQELSRELAEPSDVDRLAQERGLDPDLLMVIYTHRVTRDATKRFYVVQKEAPRLLKEWDRGRSYLEIARQWRFPPVLMAQLIEKARQTPRRTFWDAFRRPEAIPDARLRREVMEVLDADWVYSPKGGELQRARGIKGEARLAAWLKKHDLTYRTEKDLRGKFAKTPDALLDHPIILDGQKVCWIESKANFGDEVELRRNLRKQLEPYTQMFGEGAVVYWHGHLRGASSPPGILLYDGETLESLTPEAWTEGYVAPTPPRREPEKEREGHSRSEPSHPREREPYRDDRRRRPPHVTTTPPPKPRRRPVDRSAYF